MARPDEVERRTASEQRRRRFGCLVTLILVTSAAIATGAFYHSDLRKAERRVTGRSDTIATRFGEMEYVDQGEGPPLLMIHGTGGGFDQALSFSREIRDEGIRVIAPSRFGYLRSGWPAGPSSERQADAFIDLLDRLQLRKVAVAGGSAGALSAVQFALRHPERTSALILVVPAANVDGHDPNEMSPVQEWLVRRLVTSDFLFWTARTLLERQMIGFLLATDPELLDDSPEEEQRRASKILEEIQPISRRWRGMLNDAQLAGHPAAVDFSKLRVPVLVLSAEDDRFGTAATARAIASQAPQARLVIYPTGGHIFVGRQLESTAEIVRFVREHQPLAGREERLPAPD